MAKCEIERGPAKPVDYKYHINGYAIGVPPNGTSLVDHVRADIQKEVDRILAEAHKVQSENQPTEEFVLRMSREEAQGLRDLLGSCNDQIFSDFGVRTIFSALVAPLPSRRHSPKWVLKLTK